VDHGPNSTQIFQNRNINRVCVVQIILSSGIFYGILDLAPSFESCVVLL